MFAEFDDDERRIYLLGGVDLDTGRPEFYPPGGAPPSRTGLRPGCWEDDLIVGKDGASAIGTLVERTTRMVRLLYPTRRDGETVRQALTERMSDLPPALLRSITWDQGTEMARPSAINAALGVPVDFCNSRSPWQRGSNENTNGLLRDYFPQSTDLSAHSAGTCHQRFVFPVV